MTERPGAGNRRTETDAGSASVLHGASGAKLRKERSGSGPPDLHLPRCGVDAPRPETTDAQGVRVAEPRFPASALGKNSSRELQLSVRGGEDKTIRGPAGGASAPPGALPGPSRRAWPADSAAGTSAPLPGTGAPGGDPGACGTDPHPPARTAPLGFAAVVALAKAQRHRDEVPVRRRRRRRVHDSGGEGPRDPARRRRQEAGM